MLENQELWDVATAMWEWRIDPPEPSLSQIGLAAAALYRARHGKSPEKIETTNRSGPLRVLSVYAYRRQDLDLVVTAAFQVFEKQIGKGRKEYRQCLATLSQLQTNADTLGHVRLALAMLSDRQQPYSSQQQTLEIMTLLPQSASVTTSRFKYLPMLSGNSNTGLRSRKRALPRTLPEN